MPHPSIWAVLDELVLGSYGDLEREKSTKGLEAPGDAIPSAKIILVDLELNDKPHTEACCDDGAYRTRDHPWMDWVTPSWMY